MNELKLPEPDTHCLDDEGGRPIDVWSYSPELVRQIVAADRAQKSARHREELLAYELTVSNLREQNESEQCWCDAQGIGKPGISCGDCPTRDYRQPERKPLPEDDGGKP